MNFLSRLLPKTEPSHLDFAPSLLRLQEAPPNPVGRKVLWAILLLVAGLIVWMLLGQLDIVAVAQGKLVPQTYVKIVQPSEAGIVKEIRVQEGERVAAGQVLMRMDALMTEADANTLQAEYQRKQLSLRRIDAELGGHSFQGKPGDPTILANEIAAQYRANRAALDAALAEEGSRHSKARQDLAAAEQVRAKLVDTLPHYVEQEKAFDRLAQNGYAGPLMASDKKRERIEKERELKTQDHVIESARAGVQQSGKTLTQLRADYRRQLYAERNEVANALERLTQEIAKQSHRQALLELKAPQDSVVKDLATHTAGTVVQPGTVLMSLVPQKDVLQAEVWVSNDDIGFVHPGQNVKLKFAPYPFQKYGMIEGKVVHVSADAQDAPANNGGVPAQPQPLVYRALVKLNAMALAMDNTRFPLSAGMQTNAEIQLGTRSVAEYLLSPVRRAWHETGRER